MLSSGHANGLWYALTHVKFWPRVYPCPLAGGKSRKISSAFSVSPSARALPRREPDTTKQVASHSLYDFRKRPLICRREACFLAAAKDYASG